MEAAPMIDAGPMLDAGVETMPDAAVEPTP
jgi:hypothetical protein